MVTSEGFNFRDIKGEKGERGEKGTRGPKVSPSPTTTLTLLILSYQPNDPCPVLFQLFV